MADKMNIYRRKEGREGRHNYITIYPPSAASEIVHIWFLGFQQVRQRPAPEDLLEEIYSQLIQLAAKRLLTTQAHILSTPRQNSDKTSVEPVVKPLSVVKRTKDKIRNGAKHLLTSITVCVPNSITIPMIHYHGISLSNRQSNQKSKYETTTFISITNI